jgi:hypothetical protein
VSEGSAVCCIVLLGLNREKVSVWISGEEQGEGFVVRGRERSRMEVGVGGEFHRASLLRFLLLLYCTLCQQVKYSVYFSFQPKKKDN